LKFIKADNEHRFVGEMFLCRIVCSRALSSMSQL
jgi:hypothetical protein